MLGAMSEYPLEMTAAESTTRQRAGDLHERSRLGGIFYVLSWLLVSGFSPGWDRHPIASGLVTALFLGLLLMRIRVRAGFLRDPDRAVETMREQWGVLLTTGLLWGLVSGWALIDSVFDPVRPLTLIATSSLAMAFAQIFAVDRRLALLGTATVYLPVLVAVWLQGDRGIGMVLVLNGLYLVAVIGRSHREYEGKLALDAELRVERDRLAELSRTDALTGLTNRGHFQNTLADVVIEACSTGLPLALLIADLDYFKSINDRYGHTAGDHVLRTAATWLRDAFPDARAVSRIGGEEFAVLATGERVAGIAARAEALRAAIAESPLDLGDATSTAITVSLGLAVFDPFAYPDAQSLYAAADEALYRAKSGGRNRLEQAR